MSKGKETSVVEKIEFLEGEITVHPKSEKQRKVGLTLKREIKDRLEDVENLKDHIEQVRKEKEDFSQMREVLSVDLKREKKHLKCLMKALRRYVEDPQSYATCEECGREISLERLRVVPGTVRCIRCCKR